MTITPGQMKAAGRELRRRTQGEVKRSDNARRPFGQASEETLRRFASKPTPAEASQMERELMARDAGLVERQPNRGRNTKRPFEEAQTGTLRKLTNR